MVSKLDVAVIVALAAGCTVWIERGHNIIIDAPTESELVAAAAACPETDIVPYSRRCLDFLGGAVVSAKPAAMPPDSTASAPLLPPAFEIVQQAAPAPCPQRDDVPYSASCLLFLQGATDTGMRWRVRAPVTPAPVYAEKPVAAATSGRTGRNETGAAADFTPAAR